jgi:hypothetical protein
MPRSLSSGTRLRPSTKPLAKVEKLIGAHFSACRVARRSDREFEKLCEKYPDRKHWRSRENCELSGLAIRAFENLAKYTPRTAKEAGLIAAYMIKALPVECGGKIFGRVGAFGREDYEGWKIRRNIAFCHLERMLRAVAKAAD